MDLTPVNPLPEKYKPLLRTMSSKKEVGDKVIANDFSWLTNVDTGEQVRMGCFHPDFKDYPVFNVVSNTESYEYLYHVVGTTQKYWTSL